MKPRLLVIELWGVGDVCLATRFLQAACRSWSVTLLAKPFASELAPRLWPEVQVIPLVAPWTAWKGKYRFHAWPWNQLQELRIELRAAHFAAAVSARWDPRDHFLMAASGAAERLGFPRLGSGMFLTRVLDRPGERAHRAEYWRVLATTLGLELPRAATAATDFNPRRRIVVHSGAARPVRVWPLQRYRSVIARLRSEGHEVVIACDAGQEDPWRALGEDQVVAPRNLTELMALLDAAAVFIGNDSGPGHLAAVLGVPTFTLFGPQLPEWFHPPHPNAEWIAGRPCPHKPCFDRCRLPRAHCLLDHREAGVWPPIEAFVQRHVPTATFSPA